MGDENKRKEYDLKTGSPQQTERATSAGYNSYHYGAQYRRPRTQAFYENSWRSYRDQNSEQHYYKYDAKNDQNFFYEQYKANMGTFNTSNKAFEEMVNGNFIKFPELKLTWEKINIFSKIINNSNFFFNPQSSSRNKNFRSTIMILK